MERRVWFLTDNMILAAGPAALILVLLYYLVVWWRVGRDPENGVIIPLFEPPKGFSPAGVRYLARMGYSAKCMTASVIDLAVRGLLTIKDDGKKLQLFRVEGTDASAVSAEEVRLYADLLGPRKSITAGGTAAFAQASKNLKESLSDGYGKRYFITNTRFVVVGAALSLLMFVAVALTFPGEVAFQVLFFAVWLTLWTFGVFALCRAAVGQWRRVFVGRGGVGSLIGGALGASIIAFVFAGFEVLALFMLVTLVSFWVLPAAAALAVVNLVFYWLLKAPTHEGRRVMDDIAGFRMYLATAEGDYLASIRAPEKTRELFERYLPYAVALDMENEWAEQFSEVLAQAATEADEDRGYRPSWYSGAGILTGGVVGFASSLSGSFSAAVSARGAPGSRSGGGGGGGGGW